MTLVLCCAASAQDIQPHTAIYDVRLGTASGPDAPAGLSGTMVYVVEQACDGFNQVSELDVTLLDRRGRQSVLRQAFTSFEAADGRSSTFTMSVTSNRRAIDAYTGRVDLRSGGGVMSYVRDNQAADEDAQSTFDMKPDAELSLTFTAAVVDTALQGKAFISRVVADGLLDDGPNRISAVIGRRADEPMQVSDPDGLLRGSPWPVQLAYYPVASSSELPSQEMRVELYEGGVVGKIEQNMGDYTVVSTLIDLQSAKSCADTP